MMMVSFILVNPVDSGFGIVIGGDFCIVIIIE